MIRPIASNFCGHGTEGQVEWVLGMDEMVLQFAKAAIVKTKVGINVYVNYV